MQRFKIEGQEHFTPLKPKENQKVYFDEQPADAPAKEGVQEFLVKRWIPMVKGRYQEAKETAATPTKTNAYELRDQELKIEADKRAKRKSFTWKRRQQQKNERNTKVLLAGEGLRKNVPKESRKNKRQINTRKQISNKAAKNSIRTSCIFEIKGVVHVLS